MRQLTAVFSALPLALSLSCLQCNAQTAQLKSMQALTDSRRISSAVDHPVNDNGGNSPSSKDRPELQSAETNSPLRPAIRSDDNARYSSHPLTINEAIAIADGNYPKLLKARLQVTTTREGVTLRKINEYMPEALMQYQEVMASRNQISQIIYGSPVFPANPGPGLNAVSMRPLFFSGAGFNVDWQPLDFGLHKARINLSKANFAQAGQEARVTELDTAVSAGLNFLDTVVAKEQVKAAEENIRAFEQIKSSVDTQVRTKLRPGADSYLAAAELARARNSLVRAKLAEATALASLSNALGIAGQKIDINPGAINGYVEKETAVFKQPDFEKIPVMSAGKAYIATQIAQRHILSKEYYPTFHWLSGFQLRGSGLNIHAHDQSAAVHGVFPYIPNYQLAMIMNWNFLDFARLHEEKKMQNQRIRQAYLDLELVRNNLITEDLQTRAQLQAAYEIVENTRVQLQSAEMALSQAQARYNNGLSSVVALAEASQAMAQARLEEAQAHVGIWRVLLSMSALRGDLGPFLALTKSVQSGRQ